MKREKFYHEENHKGGELSILAVGKPLDISANDEIHLIVGIPKPIQDFATNEMVVPRYFDVRITFLNRERNQAVIVLAVGIPNTESTFLIKERCEQGSYDYVKAEWMSIECDCEVALKFTVSETK